MPIPDSHLLDCLLPYPQKPSGPCKAGHHQRATPAGYSVQSCAAPACNSLAASSAPLASDGLPLPSRVTSFASTRPRPAIGRVEQAIDPCVDRGQEGRGLDSVGSSPPEAAAHDEAYSSFVVCCPAVEEGNCQRRRREGVRREEVVEASTHEDLGTRSVIVA